MKKLIIGTRGSGLAMAQTTQVRESLLKAHPGLVVEVRIIKTSGDMFQNVSLAAAGGKGLFTKEIEEQLLAGGIDLAVHSMKDLPTELPDGLTIGATPRREDPRDVLITKKYNSVDELPVGARVATSSVRRRAQLLARRPDLQFEEMRGNLDTRLRKLSENDALDATLLAAAGLNRLGIRQQWPTLRWCPLDFDVMIPAVGQGIVAIEVRAEDLATQELIAPLNDADALACGEAERAFLHALGGGCHVPYAGHAEVCGNELKFIGGVFSPDGKRAERVTLTGAKAEALSLGEQAAARLVSRGGFR
jgi:hydroxymethylbilane synthase